MAVGLPGARRGRRHRRMTMDLRCWPCSLEEAPMREWARRAWTALKLSSGWAWCDGSWLYDTRGTHGDDSDDGSDSDEATATIATLKREHFVRLRRCSTLSGPVSEKQNEPDQTTNNFLVSQIPRITRANRNESQRTINYCPLNQRLAIPRANRNEQSAQKSHFVRNLTNGESYTYAKTNFGVWLHSHVLAQEYSG